MRGLLALLFESLDLHLHLLNGFLELSLALFKALHRRFRKAFG
jgi:hypothetical protein